MKTPEDEAFDDLAKRQGDWGGGFQAKRKMAADKLYHSTEARWCENFVEVKHPHIENEIVRFYFTQPAQPAQEPVAWVGLTDDELYEIVRAEGRVTKADAWHIVENLKAKLKEKNNG